MLGAMLGGMGGSLLGTLVVRLAADNAKLMRGLKESELGIKATSAVMLGQAKILATGISATLGIIGVAAVREAIKFETSFAGVRKTVNATEEEFKKFEESFRSMAKQLPINVNQINKIAESAGQLGIKNEAIVGFTKVMIDLGNTTNLEGDVAATQLARLANITQMSQKDFDKLGSTIVALGNNLATTEAEIVEMSMRIAGAGKQVGMSESQIVSFAASLSSVGVNAEAGGTAISQAMIRMAKAVSSGSEELTLFAAAAGMSAEEFQKAFQEDAAGAVLEFMEGLKRMADEGLDVFTFLEKIGIDGIRLTDVMLRASGAGDLFRRSMALGAQAWKDNNALALEAEKRYATMASQITIAWNRFKDLLITIGQDLMPAFADFVNQLKDATDWIAKTQAETGFLTATFKTVTDVIKAFALGLAVIWTTLKSISTLLATVVIGNIENFTTAIGAVIRLFGAWWDTVKGIINGLLELARVTAGVSDVMKALFDRDFAGAKRAFSAVATGIGKSFSDITSNVQKGVNTATGIVSEAASHIWSTTTELAKGGTEDLLGQWEELASFGGRLFPPIVEGIKTVKPEMDNVTKATADATNQVKALGNEIVRTAETAKREMNSDVMRKLLTGMNVPGEEAATGMNALLKEVGLPQREFKSKFKSGVGEFGEQAQSFGIGKEIEMTREKIKILEELGEQEFALTEEVQKRKLEAIEAFNNRLRELQLAQAQVIVQSGQDMFDSLGNAAAAWAGKQSGLYKTMFAASKAFAIAESIIKIQQGIASAAALPWPANLAAIASVVAATANIVSTIASVKLELGGERAAGGGVQKGKRFLVGERGPEVFEPASNGTIVPNEKIGGSTRVIINNYTDTTPQVTERNDAEGKILEVVIRRAKTEIASEIRDGRGDLSKAMENSWGLRRGKNK